MLIKENVLQFDVSMKNAKRMDITDRFAKTIENKGDLVVCQFLLFVHEFKERTIGGIL